MFNRAAFAGTVVVGLLTASLAKSAPLTVPFDFARHAIGLDLKVKGVPLYMILDTGVDPSGIDEGRAVELGLKINRTAGGEASGEGSAKKATVYPTAIENLVLGGRAFGSIDAVTLDMRGLSARYGRKLDGVLGFSFLTGKIILIDYANHRLSILQRPAEADSLVQSCRKKWTIPYTSFKSDIIPIISHFRFGEREAPVTHRHRIERRHLALPIRACASRVARCIEG